MIVILSPAKTLDFEVEPKVKERSQVRFHEASVKLVNQLKKLSVNELQELMNISPRLADLNAGRFADWKWPFSEKDTQPALYAFRGEVYTGFDADSMDKKSILYAQDHLRILSGLHGLLRPLDQILPYRLEMGTKLKMGKANDLYKFWGERISKGLNKDLETQGDDILVNLASNEYFKAVNTKELKARIITPSFKDLKNGNYKVITFFAKNARGKMARFIMENRITDPEHLKGYDEDGYIFNPDLSKGDELVFTRG